MTREYDWMIIKQNQERYHLITRQEYTNKYNTHYNIIYIISSHKRYIKDFLNLKNHKY